jgi:penicillin V acylase-like amidase (Ntn superfamily)
MRDTEDTLNAAEKKAAKLAIAAVEQFVDNISTPGGYTPSEEVLDVLEYVFTNMHLVIYAQEMMLDKIVELDRETEEINAAIAKIISVVDPQAYKEINDALDAADNDPMAAMAILNYEVGEA